jgi:hypothetical protein
LQGEVELGSGRCQTQPAVSIEDRNYETVTTHMQPSVIVWDLETVPCLGGFAAVTLQGPTTSQSSHRPPLSLANQQDERSGSYQHQQAKRLDIFQGMATLEAMSSHHNFRPGQQNKLVSEPPIATPDDHAHLVEADQRFQAALGQAIAAGGERIEAVEATVQLKRRTKLPR